MLRQARLFLLDTLDLLLGRRQEMLPPRRLRHVGPGDFQLVGESTVELLKSEAALQSSERVLDAGCGIGRVAIPLTRYLDPRGSYDGFDVVVRAIRWCQRHITPRHPNFRFHLADLHHPVYSPGGRQPAHSYVFPFPDASFDVAFLTSVFTHLRDRDVAHYLDELERVLAPGGRLFATCFLLNAESERLIASGASSRAFPCDFGDYRAAEADRPELAVAYREDAFRRLVEARRFEIRRPILYGHWTGEGSPATYQDVIVAERRQMK